MLLDLLGFTLILMSYQKNRITMKNLVLLTLIAFLGGSIIGICVKKEKLEDPIVNKEVEKALPEPKWVKVKQYSKPNLKFGNVLSDIRSHINDGGYYNDSDLITAAHETTHGINSNVRNELYDGKAINAFYCLDGKACVLNEPKTRIEKVAKNVPVSLRGGVYKLYLVEQAASGWGDRPLYILDEWVSYTNGSAARKDLQISSRAETVKYMFEFNIYVLTLLMVIENEELSYDVEDLNNFVRWNIERSMSIYDEEKEAKEYLEMFRNVSDAESLRVFVKKRYGNSWSKKYFGI